MAHNENQELACEPAYRRGFTQGVEEGSRLVLEMLEESRDLREIKRLLAVYQDHDLAPWRMRD